MPSYEFPIDTRIKSRPLYAEVALDVNATRHIFFCGAAPSTAFSRLMQEAENDSGALQLLMCDGVEDLLVDAFERFSIGDLTTIAQTLSEQNSMATAVYILGEESFLWDVANALKDQGFARERLRLLPPVTNCRRVFCTHCYHTMERVTHSPICCEGCNRLLLVRDHFSKPLGAYVGLHINAEDPTEVYTSEVLQ